MSKLKPTTIVPEFKFYSNEKQYAQDWLLFFNQGVHGANGNVLRCILPGNLGHVIDQCSKEQYARRQDFFNRTRTGLGAIEKNSFPIAFKEERNNGRYGPKDYLPNSYRADALIENRKLLRILEDDTFASYGDSPALQPGDKVSICLNTHIYQNHWGIVLQERRKGEYLIEIRSRKAPKGDGRDYTPNPPNGQLYVWASGLKKLEIAAVKQTA